MNLDSLIEFLPKSKIKAGEGMEFGEYPFFTSSNEQLKWLDEYCYDDECVIIGTGGKASINYYKGKFATSTDNYIFKTNGTVDIKYIYYYLLSNINILQDGFRGSGIEHISKDYLKKIMIPITSNDKQQTIIKRIENLDKSKFIYTNHA